jgi:hypothetical protein
MAFDTNKQTEEGIFHSCQLYGMEKITSMQMKLITGT